MDRTRTSRTKLNGRGARLGLVVARFHEDIARAMLEEARIRADGRGAQIVAVVDVPGSYDAPLAVQELLRRRDVDAVVALGAIVTGETRHDEVIAHACAQALTRLSLESGKPVSLGITGPGQTLSQARARVDRAGAAIDTVLKLLQSMAALRGADDGTRRAQEPRPRQRERRA